MFSNSTSDEDEVREEYKNEIFNFIADDHDLIFSWNRYIYIEYDESHSRIKHVYRSPELSMSNNCNVKFNIICEVTANKNRTFNFKIGLKRTDSEKFSVDVFFSVKIKFKESYEQKFDACKCKIPTEGHCFTKIIQMKVTDISFSDVYYYASQYICISGIIIAENCCKRQKERYLSIDKNMSQLQQDFKTLLKSKQDSDVSLNVGNESLHAHKFVLSVRSPVFQRMFSQDLKEKHQNSVQIEEIDKSIMEVFLSFLYTGVIEDRKFDTIFELYSVADKYEVLTLFESCRDILISYISTHTVASLLKLADMHRDEELKELAVKYICVNFSEIETTDEWGELLDMHPCLASHTLRRVSMSISK